MTDEELTIIPKNERTVNFYGDQVPVAQTGDGTLYVPLRPLTDNLGVTFAGQNERIRRDHVLAAKVRQVRMTGGDGRIREMVCLPLDMIPGWLFGISSTRLKSELQEKLDLYRAECFNVLWNAFKSDILPTVPQPSDLTPAQQMLQQAEAIYKLAQQQVELEQRYNTMADYMRGFVRDTRQQFGQHEQRLNALELRLDPASTITEEQATAITLAVKNLAYALGGSSSDVW